MVGDRQFRERTIERVRGTGEPLEADPGQRPLRAMADRRSEDALGRPCSNGISDNRERGSTHPWSAGWPRAGFFLLAGRTARTGNRHPLPTPKRAGFGPMRPSRPPSVNIVQTMLRASWRPRPQPTNVLHMAASHDSPGRPLSDRETGGYRFKQPYLPPLVRYPFSKKRTCFSVSSKPTFRLGSLYGFVFQRSPFCGACQYRRPSGMRLGVCHMRVVFGDDHHRRVPQRVPVVLDELFLLLCQSYLAPLARYLSSEKRTCPSASSKPIFRMGALYSFVFQRSPFCGACQ